MRRTVEQHALGLKRERELHKEELRKEIARIPENYSQEALVRSMERTLICDKRIFHDPDLERKDIEFIFSD